MRSTCSCCVLFARSRRRVLCRPAASRSRRSSSCGRRPRPSSRRRRSRWSWRCCARRAIVQAGTAVALGACAVVGGVRGSVPAGVAPDPAGHRRSCSGRGCGASSTRPRVVVGGDCCSCGSSRSTSAHLFAVRQRRVGHGRAALLARLRCRQPAGQRLVLPGRRALSRDLHAARGWLDSSAVRHRRERLAMAVYFLLFFAIDLVFYAGSYNYGADVRYSLMTYPPIAVLGGLGAARTRPQAGAARAMGRERSGACPARHRSRVPVPLVRAGRSRDDRRSVGGPGRRALRAGVRRGAAAQLVRADAQPGHVSSLGRQRRADVPGHLESGIRPTFSPDATRGGVYLHWNFWCNVAGSRAAEHLSRGDGDRTCRDRAGVSRARSALCLLSDASGELVWLTGP